MSLYYKQKTFRLLLMILPVFNSFGIYSQISTTITSDKVTSNYEIRAGLNNGGCSDVFIESKSGEQENIFIEFDLSNLESEYSIVHANLRLIQGEGSGGNGNILFNVYRVLKPWTEGSGSYYENEPGLNWNSSGITNWTTPGGDFAGTVYASAEGDYSNPEGTVYNLDITALANEWLNGTHPNYGLVLVPQNTDSPWFSIYSDDAEELSHRPSLEVIQEAYDSSSSIVDIIRPLPIEFNVDEQ